jgi:nucleotide sugar dehydrogenase
MRVCVVGLGRVGLTLAVQLAHKGHEVLGADIDRGRVELVEKGATPFVDEPLLDERLPRAVTASRLTASVDTAAQVAKSEAVIMVVPVGLDDKRCADFAALDAAAGAVAAGLQRRSVVICESTVPVGTTRGRLTPLLEGGSGLAAGRDFFVAYSPERVSAGRIFEDLGRYPKLVGGIDEESGARAVALYESALDFDVRPDLARENGVWNLGSAESAEFVKLAEGAYRYVNIALANELARAADGAGVDVHAAIDAANSQPFSHIHDPGISIGGHCIPVYPDLLRHGSPEAPLLTAARTVNESMPGYAIELLTQAIGSLAGRKVAILGLSYRAGVKDARRSGAFALATALTRSGAEPCVHDPWYSDAELEALGLVPYRLGDRCDAAILHTAHAEYAHLSCADLPGAAVLIDGRNASGPDGARGLRTLVVGRGKVTRRP